MSEPTMRTWIPWKPHAKQRPRVSNGRAYTSAATRKAEAAIVEAYKATTAPEMLEGPLHVTIEFANDGFWIEFRTIGEYENRKLRGDIDNYAKTVLDSLNQVAYGDDAQIGSLTLVKL